MSIEALDKPALTRNLQAVLSLVDDVQNAHQFNIGMVTGRPGLGKTTGLREIARRGGGVRIMIDPDGDHRDFVRQMGVAVGVHTGAPRAVTAHVIAKNLERQPRVIMIDEAHFMRARALQWLRHIADLDGSRTSVFILAGVSRLANNVAKFTEVDGRITFRRELEDLRPPDLRAFIPDIDQLPDESRELTFLCCRGEFRRAASLGRELMRLIELEQTKQGGDFTYASITPDRIRKLARRSVGDSGER